MQHRNVFLLLCLTALVGSLTACADRKPAENMPWNYPWPTSDAAVLDGRDLLGVYDIKDPQTGKPFQVFLLYDNGMRRGSFDPNLPYTIFAFYSSDGETWTPKIVAEGEQSLGLTEQGNSDTFVLFSAQPYYADYVGEDNPLREQVHQPRSVTLTIRGGVPSLDWQGPPDWEVKTRHVPYHREGTVFTGTIKSATAWGFASYTEKLPMTYYYLELDQPVAFDKNITANDPAEQDQRELQIDAASDELFEQVKASVGQRVTIVGSCFPAHTVYHRRPVVISTDMILKTQRDP